MLRENFNLDWTVGREGGLLEELFGGQNIRKAVNLPHDAMIHEPRSKNAPAGSQSGFYPGGAYQYEKRFFVPLDWKDKVVVLGFEGAYQNARVYINGDFAGGHPYGYTGFNVSTEGFLRYGQENTVAVLTNNSAQANSRWYSGSGLYRNVSIMVGDTMHIAVDGLRISTPDVEEDIAVATLELRLENAGRDTRKISAIVEIFNQKGELVAEETSRATVFGNTKTTLCQRIVIEKPMLWSCESPSLYSCKLRLVEDGRELDTEQSSFGIRRLQLDPVNGLRINGKTVRLRGSCIHHDNGIIGACTLEQAEERRCRILKEAGFNCIRSSHHPISRAMLDACDRMGMLVMDELWDMWTSSKNSNDNGLSFTWSWEKDVESMVEKDFNHPSVILYCMGNELKEAASPKGGEMNRIVSQKIRSLDNTRYITNALNGLLMGMDSMAQIVSDIAGRKLESFGDVMAYMEEWGKALKEKQSAEEEESGSNGLNAMMGFTNGPMGDKLAVHPIITEKIEEMLSGMDIAGYNYLTGRHELDHELSKNRIVLGTETYPAEIVRLWDIIERCPHVIGDMTWTGYDYLGEAGCGIFYYDGTQNFSSHWPDRLAYIGDIDITGYRRPISYFREIVFGIRKAPYIAVKRMDKNGQNPSRTAWMWKDNIASWTWPGFEGQTASVDVYSPHEEVELFLNGKSLGRKPAGKQAGFETLYQVPYNPGVLEAVGYTEGRAMERFSLSTAGEASLWVTADKEELRANSADLCFVEIELRDKNGILNMWEQKEVSISLTGPGTIQGYGSGEPQGENSYDDLCCTSYDGRLLAAIRAGNSKGELLLKLSAPGMSTVEIKIQIN